MHELSIAESILDIISRTVPDDELGNVRTVNLEIGALAGVVSDSLRFSFQALASGTPLAGASLSIDHVPCQVRCFSCNAVLPSPYGFSTCPRCSGTETQIVSGMELRVVSIDVSESVPERTCRS